MGKLRSKFERFCYRNREKGIPNLMLYLSIGSGLVYLFGMAAGNDLLYQWLRFDYDKIMQGQVWRLFSYVLTTSGGNVLFTLITLICYYSLGRAMENAWGTCRFNLFYFSGVVLMDVYAMAVGAFMPEWRPLISGVVDVSYLNLSLFLGYATMYPDAHFLLFFIIPVKAWIFALVDIVLTFVSVIQLSIPVFFFPMNLFPLIAIANYFLFFGKDVKNVIPMSWRVNARRLVKKKPNHTAKKQTGTIPFPAAGSYQASTTTVRAPYTHRCTVCGRTDVSNPELEFRYCSRCNGYFCYCEDHISNHTHVE